VEEGSAIQKPELKKTDSRAGLWINGMRTTADNGRQADKNCSDLRSERKSSNTKS